MKALIIWGHPFDFGYLRTQCPSREVPKKRRTFKSGADILLVFMKLLIIPLTKVGTWDYEGKGFTIHGED